MSETQIEPVTEQDVAECLETVAAVMKATEHVAGGQITLDMLEDSDPMPAETRELVEAMVRACRRMAEITGAKRWYAAKEFFARMLE